jgi:hypothetical protein
MIPYPGNNSQAVSKFKLTFSQMHSENLLGMQGDNAQTAL